MEDLRVCFLGDSYVLGQGDETGLGWPGRVLAAARASGVDLTAYNLGVRGDTAAQVAARAPAETFARFRTGDRRAVVFAFGANDINQGVAAGATLDQLGDLIQWAKAQDFAVFVLSPPVFRDPAKDAAAETLGAGMLAVCAGAAVPFLDQRKAISDWRLWWDQAEAGDGSHPGGGAYAMLAQAFVAWEAWRAWLNPAGSAPR